MANLGKRQVCDLMCEVGLALVEPYFLQTLATPIGPASPATILLTPDSPLPATEYLYPGAKIVVGWHAATAEVVTVIAVIDDNTFTANLTKAHIGGEQVFSATFPTQVPTDPVFTQSEIISYIAQAQNEFLTKVPLIFAFLPQQELIIGQPYQTLPTNTVIELERVAIQSIAPDNAGTIGWGEGGYGEGGYGGGLIGISTIDILMVTRAAGVVTALLSSSANLDEWTPGMAVLVIDVPDNSFNSQLNQPFILQTISPDGFILTWLQSDVDAVSEGGGVVARPLLTRLYESSQEQITLNQPWQSGLPGPTVPQAWWEDRSGIYGWGVSPPPPSNFWVELLASIRGPEVLNLLDYFLVPDIFLYAVKWRALAYCWAKTGVQRSPTLERFAKGKYDFYCLLADRFLRNVIDKQGRSGAMMGGMF